MDNFIFNTLDAATQGLLSNDSFSIAVQGLLSITIEEIPIPPNPEEVPEFQSGGVFHEAYSTKKKKEKLYKIKVTVSIKGNVYTQEKIVAKLKKPKISDIEVDIKDHRNINISLK